MLRVTFVAVVLGLVGVACATGTDSQGGDQGNPDPNATSTDGTNPAPDGGNSGGQSAAGNDAGGGGNTDSGGGGGGGGTDSGGGGGTCSGYAAPNTSAKCVDTQYCGGSKPACNANGCDGAYWCDLSTKKCVKKPSSC